MNANLNNCLFPYYLEGTSDPSLVLWILTGVLGAIAIIAFIIMAFLFFWKKESAKKLEDANEALQVTNEKIREMATIDFVTGLRNHSKFNEDIAGLCEEGKPFTLLMLDVNNFKSVNDLFGHKTGDEVLSEISIFLIGSLPEEAEAYRYGGDEFSILVRNADKAKTESLCNKISLVSVNPFHFKSGHVRASLSIGVAQFPKDGKTAEELIVNADSALYFLKNSTRSGYAFYNPAKMTGLKNNSFIGEALEKAIVNNDVVMHFQPIYSCFEKRFVSSEALMRIKNLAFGPAAFIPVAEQTGAILPLGRIALKQSVEFVAKLQKEKINDVAVCINFSGAQVADSTYLDFLVKELAENQVSPQKIVLELTESFFFHNSEYLTGFISKCSKIGVRISLDDFGSGYSAVQSLTKFRFSEVKLDKTIIDSMLDNHSVATLIKFCHEFGYHVVAEGVERKDQLEYLNQAKCDYIQGYYFSRELTRADALAFFKKQAEAENIKN